MKHKIIYLAAALVVSALVLTGMRGKNTADDEAAVLAAEKAFQDMVADKGIAIAFYYFADEDAVIKRQHDTLIKGRSNILKFYTAQNLKNATVTWKPDFVSVSKSGDMAYTYGKYLWERTTDAGAKTSSTGVFHTVWKKQADGSWKYVWD